METIHFHLLPLLSNSVTLVGLQPTTLALEVPCSMQLSYKAIKSSILMIAIVITLPTLESKEFEDLFPKAYSNRFWLYWASPSYNLSVRNSLSSSYCKKQWIAGVLAS